ncbi:MAG: acyltransferase [Rhodospirillales bacterium]|nr:acyltransferase [Rhodospirillales bacterium]
MKLEVTHSQRQPRIELARGVAAILVVAFHAAGAISSPRFGGTIDIGRYFAFARNGVDIFFVLSGFIISYAHAADIGRPARLRRYLGRRFVRIFPPYWAVCALIIPIYLLVPSLGDGDVRSFPFILQSVLLVPMPYHASLIGVAWSLSYELLFYAIFAVAIWSRVLGTVVFALWLAGIIVCAWLQPSEFALSFVFDLRNLEFFFGIAVAAIARRSAVDARIWVTGVALFAVLGALEAYAPPVHFLWYGFAGALIVLGLAGRDRMAPAGVGRVALLFGAASYAIYLVHYFAISAVARIVLPLAPGIIGGVMLPVVLLILISSGVAAGLVFHVFVERPAVLLGRRLLGDSPRGCVK